jgi:hypothetical protein
VALRAGARPQRHAASERPPKRQRKSVQRDRDAERRAELAGQRMRAVPISQRADDDQNRQPAKRATRKLAARERSERQHESEQQTG